MKKITGSYFKKLSDMCLWKTKSPFTFGSYLNPDRSGIPFRMRTRSISEDVRVIRMLLFEIISS